MEIYTDKAQNKVIIVTNEHGLEDLRAACIAYSVSWTEKNEEKTSDYVKENNKRIADKYSDYWIKMYDAGMNFKKEEE